MEQKEKLTPEQLMAPRWKVIADYPLNEFEVGYIFNDVSEFQIAFFRKYPHLFKECLWWEGREVEEMPEYLKKIEGGITVHVIKAGWRVQEVTGAIQVRDMSFPDHWLLSIAYQNSTLPATEAEYLAYQAARP